MAAERLESLVDLLLARTARWDERRLFSFLTEGEVDGPAEHYSFAELDRRARSIAAALQNAGLTNRRVLLLFPPGLDFISSFFGCLYAGAVAVPTVAPHPARPERSLPHLRALAADAGPRAVLTTPLLRGKLQPRLEEDPALRHMHWLVSNELSEGEADDWRRPDIDRETLAFLQYTSGSTGEPRGVMLSHGNLLSNLRLIEDGFRIESSKTGVHWLPFYHDMGLIGGILGTLHCGGKSVFMSPLHFLQKPLRWLRAISQSRAYISGGPDFAYRLCAERATPELIEQLDLSSWRVAFTGAEPIRSQTVRKFCETFAPSGFRGASIFPCYGLAESTLLVTGGQADEPPKFLEVDAPSLAAGETVRTEIPAGGLAREIVGCGKIGDGHELRIVDPDTRRALPAGTIGEIWTSGPSVARGYWGKEELTEETFGARLEGGDGGRYLRTGDMGFTDARGELFFAGREKDLIILRGRNHYPQDIEKTVEEAHRSVRAGCVAAFSIEAGDEDSLIVVCEVGPGNDSSQWQEVASAVRQSVAEEHGVSPHSVALVKPGGVPKTSSGKIRRWVCKQSFTEGTLAEIARFDAPSTFAATDDGKDAATLCAASGSGSGAGESEARPSSASPSHADLLRRVGELVAEQAGLTPEQIDPAAPFARYGIDSLRAVAISGVLEGELNRKLSPALLYNYPTAGALAKHLSGASTGRRGAGSGVGGGAVAIVGMGCRFPGGAVDTDSFWRLLVEGVDAVGEVPPARAWPADAPRWGGWLEDIDLFDPAAFGISPREAAGIDPQQRLLLEVASEALENAGLPVASIAGEPVGVFVGVSSNDYAWQSMGEPGQVDAWSGTGNAHSICANRLSYVFDLRGPSMAIDTACSSSLVAVRQACSALRSGEASMALACGVNVILAPQVSQSFEAANMLAADGRCKTFDADADGYARGEGCGVLVLKLLEDALRDGDRVSAVIRGTAINQDGRSNGLTAPNGNAQIEVIEAALADAGLSADVLGYVETHGTGTPLGDPIELDAVASVLGERPAERRCALGSVKTNVGHLEPAAGIAGLIKTALMVERGVIPPHLNLRRLNPAIDLERAPFFIPDAAEEWPGPPEGRFAGVSSFGFGGTNAHCVVSGPPPTPAHVEPESEIQVLTLSARTEKLLRRLALRFAAHLDADPGQPLADITRSANLGRTPREWRLAVPAASVAELADELRRYAETPEQSKVSASRVANGGAPGVAFSCPDLSTIELEAFEQLRQTDGLFRRSLSAVAPELEGQSFSAAGVDPRKLALSAQLALAGVLRAWGVEPCRLTAEGSGAAVAAVLSGRATRGQAEEWLAQSEAWPEQAEAWPEQTGDPAGAGLVPFAAAEEEAETSGGVTRKVSLGRLASFSPARSLREILADLYVAGVPLNWRAVDGREWGARLPLPTTPFDRRSFWRQPKRAPLDEAPQTGTVTAENPSGVHARSSEHRNGDQAALQCELRWSPLDIPADAGASRAGSTKLLLLADPATGERAASTLRQKGYEVSLCAQDASAAEIAAHCVESGVESGVGLVLKCWPPAAEAGDDTMAGECAVGHIREAVELAQALTAGGKPPSLCFVTWGAHAVDARDAPPDPSLGALTALLRTIELEHPELKCNLLDLDSSAPDEFAAMGAALEALRQSGEVALALRRGTLFAPRLHAVGRNATETTAADKATVRADGTYLITGATGALGIAAAERLAGMGAGRLLLTARREAGEEVRKRVEAVEAGGTACEWVYADVADFGQMESLFARLELSGHSLRGVVHCAGVLDDVSLRGITPERLDGVLSPKIRGAWNLHRLTLDRPLDFFVLYSSASAVFGNRGQAAYAAANAFTDTLAEARRARGLAASSVAWGPWAGGGMAAEGGLSQALEAAAGLGRLDPAEALDVLEDVLKEKPVRRLVMKFDAARLASHLARNARLLDVIVGTSLPEPASRARKAAGNGSNGQALSLPADPGRRRAELSAFLEEKIRASLDLSADTPFDPAAPLSVLGVDSLMTVEISGAVSERGLVLPVTALTGDVTLEKLVDQLAAASAPAPIEGPTNGDGAAHAQDAAAFDAGQGIEKFWERMQPSLDRVELARSLDLYHFEKPITSFDGAWVTCADGERRLMLATHNYLGLLDHPHVRQSVLEAVERFGGGSHGSRLMGGSLQLHQRLEQKVAEFTGREAAMVLSTGYVTNSSVIAALVGPGDWVISDQWNHASILDGCNASGAMFRVYRHNHLGDLEQVLRAAPAAAVKLVVADGVFSMDGDIADLPGLSSLCRRYGALLMIDEAHSLGVLGENGRGIEEHFGMPGAADICMGTLSKTLSSMGGYIAGSRRLIDFLKLTARGYFFSTAPPAPVIAASLAALEVLEDEGRERCERLRRNTSLFIEGLQSLGFDTGVSCTAIVPALLGTDERAVRMADYGQRHGLFVLPALPPAVPAGTARLRLTVSTAHSADDLRFALGVLARGARELQVLGAASA